MPTTENQPKVDLAALQVSRTPNSFPEITPEYPVAIILSNLHNTLNVLHAKMGEIQSLLLSAPAFETGNYISELATLFNRYREASLHHTDYLAKVAQWEQQDFYERLRLQYHLECTKIQTLLLERKVFLSQNL